MTKRAGKRLVAQAALLSLSGQGYCRGLGTGATLSRGAFAMLYVGMITVGVIRNGATYLSHHLRKNDYWSEGEKEVRGEWIGEGAKALGLADAVTDEPFDALRKNRNPRTGEPLTSRDREARVAFFDVQLSAPKDVSVLAMVGGDERIREAFVDSVKTALAEMERFAAVRERRGEASGTEAYRLTGNFAGAMFLHDTSRDLDPQLHAHAVLANATWDATRGEWLALQPVEMLRASAYLRQVMYRELAGRLRALGYEPHEMNSKGFSVRGMEHLRERFSKRARHVQQLANDFAKEKGRRPTKRETEVLVRESREDKLTEVSTPEVRARQRKELNPDEARRLADLVRTARKQAPREQPSVGQARVVLEDALRHVYERNSVAREGEVLSAAMELHPDFYRWRELTRTLAEHPEIIRRDGEMSLRSIREEESATVRRARSGRNQRFSLGDPAFLSASLTPGQMNAARTLLGGRDFVSVLVGDAGTGKTTLLTAVEQAHLLSGGRYFLPLAPTTRARDALTESGFKSADTVQRFLVSEAMHAQAVGRVLLVDEAGLLSTHQLERLTLIAETVRARVLLVGDTKQHYSVERGDALRNVVKHAGLPVVRLAEVLRQRRESDRQFSRLLASGRIDEAFYYADRRGLFREAGDDETMFAQAAEHYAANRKNGVETMVVIPFWEEIDRFNQHVRPALRRAGLLGEAQVVREAVRPLTWTEEQKAHWDQYQVGDRLLFIHDVNFHKRGTAAEVVAIQSNGLRVRDESGRETKITRRQRSAFDVGRAQTLAVSAGEQLLIRGRDKDHGFANGDLKIVAAVDTEKNRIVFTDGGELPPSFAAWTYGHAQTSYRSQGSTSEESLMVLGEVAARALKLRQFYVGNTRYRGSHAIYVSDRAEILRRLSRPDDGRELATEFVKRQRIVMNERVGHRRDLRTRMRAAWASMADTLREWRENLGERRSV